MRKMSTLGRLAMILLIIGGLNWGLIGFFNLDLVSGIFGGASLITRIIFAVVGLAALYSLYGAFKMMSMKEM